MVMRKFRILTLLLLTLPMAAAAVYLFKTLDAKNGLTSSQINCILKDGRGYVWFGTPAGLYRFDGHTFTNFQCDSQDGFSLPDSYINTIQEALDGTLWINTAAGYCIYGPQTMLALTTGGGVQLFTLDPASGTFLLTHSSLRVPDETQEFAINMSNSRHWAAPMRRYITECLLGADGGRGKNFNMRWIASMVADVHRVLLRGGIFMYPWDKREPKRPGKLRLMYEANPMSWLIEQAGGAATNGKQAILDIQPAALHERVAVMLGSKNEVQRVTRYHSEEN